MSQQSEVVAAGLLSSAEFSGERRTVIAAAGSVVTIHEPLAPPAGGALGRVVIVPGWSGPRSGPADILVFLASKLAQAGWRVLRLDIPTRGDAGGDRTAVGLDEMIAAALAVAACEGKDPEAQRTVFLGMCSGGNVSLGAVTLALQAEGAPAALRAAGVIALSALPFQPSRAKNIERRRAWKNLKQYAGKAASPLGR